MTNLPEPEPEDRRADEAAIRAAGATGSSDEVPVLLDVYNPHMTEEVQELVKIETGSPIVYLGGGATDVQAACDVNPHHVFRQEWLNLSSCVAHSEL